MKTKKLISLLLCMMMLFGGFALSAFANAWGDVNGDGAVTAADARLCLRRAVGLETYAAGSDEFNACDVNGDGIVTAADARLILRAAVGLIDPDVPETDLNNNEYNILRSGKFCLTGSMCNAGETMPMELAITEKTVYMRTQMDGIDMAILQAADKKVYMIVPEKKIYMHMSDVVLGLMGMSSSDLIDIDNMGFSDMPALSEADSVAPGEFNGSKCTVYTFNNDDGSRIYVYMYGNKLLGFENTEAGMTDVTYITSITADVPSDMTAPPAGYKKVNLITFVTTMNDLFN